MDETGKKPPIWVNGAVILRSSPANDNSLCALDPTHIDLEPEEDDADFLTGLLGLY